MGKNKNFKPYIFLLAAMYLAGLIGLNLAVSSEIFKALTPFNLLTSLVVLLYFHSDWNKASIVFCVGVFLFGYFIEVLGVHTGLLFGKYHYDTTLGFKILNVPPLIGINWLLLIYCVGIVADSLFKNTQTKVVVGAFFLSVFDFIVEPIAIRLDMWSWEKKMPTIQNYVVWFMVSALLLGFFYNCKFSKRNPIAVWLLLFQCLFFLIQVFV